MKWRIWKMSNNVVGFTVPKATPRGAVKPKAKRGRPALPEGKRKTTVTFRLESDLTTWLRQQKESQASLIENALRKTYKIKKPK